MAENWEPHLPREKCGQLLILMSHSRSEVNPVSYIHLLICGSRSKGPCAVVRFFNCQGRQGSNMRPRDFFLSSRKFFLGAKYLATYFNMNSPRKINVGLRRMAVCGSRNLEQPPCIIISPWSPEWYPNTSPITLLIGFAGPRTYHFGSWFTFLHRAPSSKTQKVGEGT